MAKVLNLEEPQVIESGKHYVYCLWSHFVYVFLNTNKRMQQHLLRNHQTRAKQAVDVYWLSIYIYTYKQSSTKFTNMSSKQQQSWLKDHIQTTENYQILYAKLHVLFKNIQQKITTKFLSTLVLSLALEKFIYAKPNQKYLNMLQYYSIGCSLANRDTKDPIVLQTP